ncbi:MAG: DUF3300 domain-containing protein [Syntrophobacteraceae bacterium]|nr:DUF3300 domain-containing protein [Syntrophobacteraceae bacterium]
MNFRKLMKNLFLAPIILIMAAPPWVFAQNSGGGKAYSQGQLEQMLAPIALYPDSLLAEVLMASTYPVQVVEADRWVKNNAGLKGDALNGALDKMNWDMSVKALVPFPQVLSMMSDQLAWTENLGDAFVGQQALVMSTVQKLRARAGAQNALKTNTQQKVVVEQQIIRIEPADPQVIYVPAYNPVVVYGAWPYPAYPPYPYYPAGAVVAAGAIGFAAGVAVGAAWNNGWGHWNWGHGSVNVNVNRNININNIHVNNLKNTNFQTQKWQHNSAYGKGAAYNRQNYSRTSAGAAGRQNYSGRTTSRSSSWNTSSHYSGHQSGGAYGHNGSIGRTQQNRPSAFQGIGNGNQTRSYSSRGSMSRQSAMRSGGGFGGYGGGGGGFGRGGGGFRRR